MSGPSGARLWIFRLALVPVALVLCLASAEIAVRAGGIAPRLAPIEIDAPWGGFVSSENPRLLYVPRPGAGGVNDYGIRDRDIALEKPAGVYRIAVIGDSYAFGLCIDDPFDTFPKRLEAELSEATGDARIEVVNLGVSGYDTEQEVEFLAWKGLALSPDLVLVSFVLNDYQRFSWELRHLEKREGWERRQRIARTMERGALAHSHLARLLLVRVPALAGSSASEEGDPATRGFARLAALSDEHGFGVLVVVWPYIADLRDYGWVPLHEKTAALAREAGFAHLDLLEPLRREMRGSPERYRCEDGHPNERGHALAARVIERHLRSAPPW